MKIKCPSCAESIEASFSTQHRLGDRCKAAWTTREFIRMGLRPFPLTHSLPEWVGFAFRVSLTRGKYEGEPREDMGFLPLPVKQLWVPRWIDIIADLWSGPIYIEGEHRKHQRDLVLEHVKTLYTSGMKQQIVDAYREDLRAVRDLLKPIIIGELPQLLVDFEKVGGRPMEALKS